MYRQLRLFVAMMLLFSKKHYILLNRYRGDGNSYFWSFQKFKIVKECIIDTLKLIVKYENNFGIVST